ncbi:MAG: HD domain-containing phosphohydrolase, partial [Pseudolabrys sp.]
PELEATVDFSQEAGRRHKDVWEHTKQVVRQSVPKPAVRWAALLHDIGKLGVSNTILDKPGKLDANEWIAIKLHPLYSEQILARIAAFSDLATVAGAHHERLDGKGYPHGLSGYQIVLETRIITVADIFDALTAERPYRAAMPVSKAFEIMAGDVGTAIDAECFAALRRAMARLEDSQAA